LDAEPFYKGVRFRRSYLDKGECAASECSLMAKDFWRLGYGRVIIVPSVKIVYWSESHEQVHRDISPAAVSLTVAQKNFLKRDFLYQGGKGSGLTVLDDESWVQPMWLWKDEESKITWRPAPAKIVCLPLDGPGVHFADEKHPMWEASPNPTAPLHPKQAE
jgi:alpha-1,3-mannosyltransferase